MMKLYCLGRFTFPYLIVMSMHGQDCEISWSDRSEKDLPSATVRISVNGVVTDMEHTASGGDGLVTKDGNFAVYSYAYDSNGDGIVNLEDQTKLKVVKIDGGNFTTVKEVENAWASDVTADGKKLAYIGKDKDGMCLMKYNLLDTSEAVMFRGAKWLGHVAISPDDQWCAIYISNEQYNNQVVLIGSNYALPVSQPVGNGWGLVWIGSILFFFENDMKDRVLFDPYANKRVSEESMKDLSTVDKHKSGWPKIEAPAK